MTANFFNKTVRPIHLPVTGKYDICSTIKKEVYMKLKSNEYQIECTP